MRLVVGVKVLLLGLVLAQEPAHGIILETDTAPVCRQGQGLDATTGACVADPSGVRDEDRLQSARRLLSEDRFADALAVLDAVEARNTARYFNYRGFATRKLGRPQEAVAYYQRALLLDPYYVEAREYLGEAYLMLDRADLAKDQLALIAQICGGGCEAYDELKAALSAAGH